MIRLEDDHLSFDANFGNTEFAYGLKGCKSCHQFLSDVQTMKKYIGDGSKYGLFSHDSYLFSVAFFSLLSLNKQIVLPNNDQQGRLESLNSSVTHWIRDDLNSFECLDTPSHLSALESLNISLDQTLELWTSGSSGQPKSIHKTLRQLFLEVKVLKQHFPINEEKVYATVPHYHIYGLLFKILLSIVSHKSFNRENSFTLEEFQAKFNDSHSYQLISCPAHLKRLPEALKIKRIPPNFKQIFSSGGPCSPETSEWWSKHNMDITEVYGSTESGGVAYRKKVHLNSEWTHLPEVQLKTIDNLLYVKSPFTGSEDWLKMGDKAELNPDAKTFNLLGRGDRIAKVEEKRVSLIEMEEHLKKCPEIIDAFVFQSNLQTSSHSALYSTVVLSKEDLSKYYQQGHRKFFNHIKLKLEKFFEPMTLPKYWRVCSEIPINSSGKRTSSSCEYLFKDPFAESKNKPYILDIQSIDQDNFILQLESPYHLHYFKGHFPNYPILAGVVQLHWAKQLAEQVFNKKVDITSIRRLKFKSVICPGDNFELHLKLLEKKSQFDFIFKSTQDIYSSGSLSFIQE